MKKANKVFIRLGVADILIEVDENYDSEADTNPENISTYFVGCEDADGNECDENGIYLSQ